MRVSNSWVGTLLQTLYDKRWSNEAISNWSGHLHFCLIVPSFIQMHILGELCINSLHKFATDVSSTTTVSSGQAVMFAVLECDILSLVPSLKILPLLVGEIWIISSFRIIPITYLVKVFKTLNYTLEKEILTGTTEKQYLSISYQATRHSNSTFREWIASSDSLRRNIFVKV